MTDMRERLAEILVGYVDSYMGFASKKDMQDRALEAADAVIAARWHDTPATPSGAQQVTDEMVEAALAEFIEQDWPRDQSDENAECLRSDMRAALEAAIAVPRTSPSMATTHRESTVLFVGQALSAVRAALSEREGGGK